MAEDIAWTIDDFEAQMRAHLTIWQSRSIEDAPYKRDMGGRRRWRIYTDRTRYTISANPPCEKSPAGYLGCIAQARKPRAGEDWTRGNDLPDGPLEPATWLRILAGIVAYELVKVHDPAKALADASRVPPPAVLPTPTGTETGEPAAGTDGPAAAPDHGTDQAPVKVDA